MPPDIIKQQQEVARNIMAQNRQHDFDGYAYMQTGSIRATLDEIVATLIANIGRELEARCENSKQELDDTMAGGSHINLLIKSHNEGIDRTITIIRDVTGNSPTS